jgi:hypothetical protein
VSFEKFKAGVFKLVEVVEVVPPAVDQILGAVVLLYQPEQTSGCF